MKIRFWFWLSFLSVLLSCQNGELEGQADSIQSIAAKQIRLGEGFWAERLKINQEVSQPLSAAFQYPPHLEPEDQRITHGPWQMGNVDSLNAIWWEELLQSKIYLTGGIGQGKESGTHRTNYALPNNGKANGIEESISFMKSCHALFLSSGESKYMDLFERVLYNAYLSSISLDGRNFFPWSPLNTDEITSSYFQTLKDFENNIDPAFSIFMDEIPGYAYAQSQDIIYINLFMQGKADLTMHGRPVGVELRTNYPWDANLEIELSLPESQAFSIALRVPAWAKNMPVPSELYQYRYHSNRSLELRVNEDLHRPESENGYALIHREWKDGDKIQFFLPMAVRRVVAHDSIVENEGKIALERGPLVYCLEGIDHGGSLENMTINQSQRFFEESEPDVFGGIISLNGIAKQAGNEINLRAIPFYSRGNRGLSEYSVWIP